MHNKPKIVFFGTGPVAARSLELLAKNFEVEAVVTKPKPAHHRGSFPVIESASKLSLPIHTVTDKKSTSSLMADRTFKSRVGILIDFGIIVSQDVIDSFEKGIINSHFSLLPEWRGADPITFSILSGQNQTGVSLMLLVAAMDEGPLIAQSRVTISDSETTPTLTKKLIEESNQLLKKLIPQYIIGEIHPKPQDDITIALSKTPTYSRKLTKQDGLIDWNDSVYTIERKIRAFVDWPQSKTRLGTVEVIITQAHAVPSYPPESYPGDITVSQDIGVLMVATADGSLCIERLKPVGKKEMDIRSFLAGYKGRLQTK